MISFLSPPKYIFNHTFLSSFLIFFQKLFNFHLLIELRLFDFYLYTFYLNFINNNSSNGQLLKNDLFYSM